MAATEASGSMSTTLVEYSRSEAEVPGARCSRSLKGCVSALRPAEAVSVDEPSVRSSGRLSIKLIASCSFATSNPKVAPPAPRRAACVTSSSVGALSGGGSAAERVDARVFLAVNSATAEAGGEGEGVPRKRWQKASRRKVRRSVPRAGPPTPFAASPLAASAFSASASAVR